MTDEIRVEVVDATGDSVVLKALTLRQGATAGDAVDAAGLTRSPAAIGVFGELVERPHVLADGDRVDLLRPTLIDPMEARRQRARAM